MTGERLVGVRSRARLPLTAILAAAVAATGLVAAAGRAAADGPTTFSNTTEISVPATGSANQIGPASPYPTVHILKVRLRAR